MCARVYKKKSLLLATAVRNPERFPDFLAALKPYEGNIFNEKIARKVAQKLIAKRLYNPSSAIKYVNKLLKYKNNDCEMTDEDALTAVNWSLENLSGHGAGGFEKKSWGGRVVEWFNLMQEMGAVLLQKDKKIIFSEYGNGMVRVSGDASVRNSGALVANFWLNGLSKLQPKSPFRSGTTVNKPFVLMLNTIIKLSEKINGKNPGLSRNEISFLLNWDDNDADELSNYIISIRKTYGKKLSSDLVYSLVMSNEHMLKGETEKRFKKQQVVHEIVDDWMRKCRETGIINIRGFGRYLDIMPEEMDKAKYIILNYSKPNLEMDTDKYFSYVAQVDDNITFSEVEEFHDNKAAKMNTINRLSQLSWDKLEKELMVLSGGNRSSKDDLFKLISDPLRFEFLSAIVAHKSFPNAHIEANYSADDEGLPKSTAVGVGDTPDLFIKDNDSGATIEVTLQTNKQQAVNEIPAITYHLEKMKKQYKRNDYFSVFVAKNIHKQSNLMVGFVYASRDDLISTYNIPDFIKAMKTSSRIDQLKKEPKERYVLVKK